jgi:outer membrane receptor for ferrienterochelin and colicins
VKLVAFIFAFTPSVVFAQITVSIDDDNGKPLPSAHLTYEALNGDSKSTVLSTVNGVAIIPEVFTNTYYKFILTISYLGFTTLVDTVSSEISELNLKLEQDQFALSQVVVTAQYAPTSADKSVHSIKIIDRKRIEQQAAVNLRDLLQKETNMRVSQDNILGSGLSVQGISGQNVKFLVDGVPIIGRLDGNIDLSQINLNNVERVEVVEGPLSVNFGTDALAGTINIITRKPKNNQLNVELNSYYESVGQYNVDARVALNMGSHGFTLSGGRNYFDGWSPDDAFFEFPKKTLADNNRTKDWKPKEQLFASAQYIYKHKTWSFRPYGEWFQEEIINRGTPRSPYYTSAFDDRYLTERTNGGLDISGKVHQEYRLAVLAAYNHFTRTKNTFYRDLTSLESSLTANSGDQDTSRFDQFMSRGSVARVKPNAKINFELGYDINVEMARGKRIEGVSKTIGDYAFYGSLEYTPVEGLTLRPGVRYGYNSEYKAPITPSFNVRYSIKKFTIRASYARGFRAPTTKELYFNFVDVNHNIQGSTNLKSEHSDNVSVSVGWKLLKKQTSLKVEVAGYYNDIRNMITLGLAEGSATEFTYLNIGNFRTVGGKLNTSFGFHHFKANLGFAYVGRYNQVSDSLNAPPFSFTPEFRAALTYELKSWNTSIAVFYNYVGALLSYTTTEEGGVGLREVADYHLLDVTISKKFWKERIVWSVGAKNLLNVQQVNSNASSGGAHSGSASSVPVAWGRSVFTSLALRFNTGLKKK